MQLPTLRPCTQHELTSDRKLQLGNALRILLADPSGRAV